MSTGTSIELLLLAIGLSACTWHDLPDVDFPRACDGRELELCDIRQADCQTMYFEYVACLREREGAPMPAVRVVTPDQLPRTSSTSTTTENFGHALALVDLLEHPSALEQREEVFMTAGFYDSRDRSVTIVDRGVPLDTLESVLVLVHEGVHAMQDAEHNLDAFVDEYAGNDDQFSAALSVIEGEAEIYRQMVLAVFYRGTFFFDHERLHEENVDVALRDAARHPSPFLASQVQLPYRIGASYVASAWQEGYQSAVDELFQNPPRSSAQIMSGYSAARDSAPILDLEPRGLDNYELIFDLTLGRWHYDIALRRAILSLQERYIDYEPASEAASGWDGDRFLVWERAGDKNIAVVWIVRLTAEMNATQAKEIFVAAPLVYQTSRRFAAKGKYFVLVASEDESELDAWLASALEGLDE